ncbi:hypothetical protein, partial [Shigella boydii]|uniref:hypothetical protein n=1 Tax=Shigella boydii TaxID=621 RepID=UPI001C0A71EA
NWHCDFLGKTKKIQNKGLINIYEPASAGFFILDNVPHGHTMYQNETTNRQDAHEVAAWGI